MWLQMWLQMWLPLTMDSEAGTLPAASSPAVCCPTRNCSISKVEPRAYT